MGKTVVVTTAVVVLVETLFSVTVVVTRMKTVFSSPPSTPAGLATAPLALVVSGLKVTDFVT